MDKNKENTLHTNEHYSVILMLKDERDRLVGGENYKVVHNVHGTAEKYSQCYPEALGAAEYYNDILINRSYLCKQRSSFADELECLLSGATDESRQVH